ncbi:lumican [Ictalurus furcatus]|uniref:lumican n=1 Tax=Ictalurus furcatus TaxID=66913 RepID=UPI00235089A6|nr:lumican [Ictalurus furcatus]
MDIRPLLVILSVCGQMQAMTVDTDYGGLPLQIDRFLGEPTIFTLRNRVDSSWSWMVSNQNCSVKCDCAIQWPTALYCDHKGLEQFPESLPSRTKYLFLQANMITGFNAKAFVNTTNLRWLILDQNQLLSERLDGRSLVNLTQLVNLFMNHNNLSEVPAGLPGGLKQLRLAYNQIEKIGPGAFENLQNLTLLLLQGNRLRTIEETDFKGLSILNLLDLSRNVLGTFPKHLPPSVQQLYLSHNALTGMAEDSLQGFKRLCYLRLRNNQLKNDGLGPGVFNVTSLVELDLSFNQLTEIPVVPTTLQYLYLEVNRIREFNVSSLCRTVGLMSYSHIKILRLDGNKIDYHQLPPDWVYCLRILQNIYI